MRSTSVQKMVAAGLLTAIGILIPMVFPKINLPPASFTLASHVAIFLAMMISPAVAIAVAVGTTAGFFIGGLHITIVARAASHLVFVLVGSLYMRRRPGILERQVGSRVFSLLIGAIHAGCEVLVILPFYFVGGLSAGYYEMGFLRGILLLIGFGSLVHSMVDFEIALLVSRALAKQRSFAELLGRRSPAVREI